MAEDALTQRIYKDIPQAFIGAALGALAEMTMEFMAQETREGGDLPSLTIKC
jgi:hypothetical protein